MNQNENENKNKNVDKKFILSLALGFFAIFLGAFLAFYVIFNNLVNNFNVVSVKNANISQFMTSPENVFDRFDKQFSDRIEQLNKNNQFFSNTREFQSSNLFNNQFSVVKLEENKDKDVIRLDLKPFDNNVKNVNIETKNNRLVITAKYKDKKNNNINSSSFYQSLNLGQKIKPDQIKQEVKNGILTITILKTNNSSNANH